MGKILMRERGSPDANGIDQRYIGAMSATTGGDRRNRMSLGAIILVWTLVPLIPWIVLANVWGEDCSGDEFVCFDSGDVFFMLAPFALLIWLIGLVFIWHLYGRHSG
jgi:hypothetical protein